jgi:cytochrome c553
MTKWIIAGLLVGNLGLTTPASADGDPVAGRAAAETCMGCHALEGYFNVYPSYHVPRIGGQQAGYIVSALKAYRDGSRQHGTMHANAVNLTDDAIADIAAFVASQGQ